LEAVRDLEWKLVLPVALTNSAGKAAAKSAATPSPTPLLFNLKQDPGETTDLARQHPDIVARLEKLVANMKDDLGISGPAPGSRPLGKVDKPQPIIGFDGKVREEFRAGSL
jgi:arylsulfatase